jgi:hypothetical protein
MDDLRREIAAATIQMGKAVADLKISSDELERARAAAGAAVDRVRETRRKHRQLIERARAIARTHD